MPSQSATICKRDFLRLTDLSTRELQALLDRAIALKNGADRNACPLIGKSVVLLFEKSSTRTRVSFETGIYQLGAQPIYLNSSEIQLGRGETIADTARTLSRYVHAITMRTHSHQRIEEFASWATVPVINALTDAHHPCQALADLMTIQEHKGRTAGVSLTYVGDGNNVANSLIEAAMLTGMTITIACPKGYEPDAALVGEANAKTPGLVRIVNDPAEAARDADVLYTDVWVSMGMEEETIARRKAFAGFQIDSALLSHAKPDAIVMHCLPAHRGEEISANAIDGPQSVVFDQAENRLHAQKALLEHLLAAKV